MASLYYQGHGSYRITTDGGTVVYVDPYVGDGYGEPADLILVTHEHMDHNRVGKPARKPGCVVIRAADALKNGEYGTFRVGDVSIEATEAYNRNHPKDACVGFVLSLDGKTVYAAGDTSLTEEMKTLGARKLDWVLLPIDGVFNMGPEEASRCAGIIGAAHAVPVHMAPGRLFSRKRAEAFHAAGRVILEPGESTPL